VRLYGGTLLGDSSSASAGSVIALDAKGARIAASGGVLLVSKLKVGAGAKVAAAEAGIAIGARLR
jgi:hypothetical protein